MKGLPTAAKSFSEPDATSSVAEVVPKSVAKARWDELHDDGMHLAAMATAAMDTRAQEWSTCMEAWKANCVILDEKVTAATKQLDENVVAISRQRAEKEAIAAKQLQAREEDCDLFRTVGSKARHGDRAAERRARGFGGGRIFDEIRGEQMNGDDQRALEPSGCGIRETQGVATRRRQEAQPTDQHWVERRE